eukprot:124121-Hanusia_phi.AAC.2
MEIGIRYAIKSNGEVHVAHVEMGKVEGRCDAIPKPGDQLVRIGKRLVPALVDEETIDKMIQEECQTQTELRLVFRTDQLQEYRSALDITSFVPPLTDAQVDIAEEHVREGEPACSEVLEDDEQSVSIEESQTVQELKEELRHAHSVAEQQVVMMERQRIEYEEELATLREESFKRVQAMQDQIAQLTAENASMRKDLEQMNETFRTALALRGSFSPMSPREKGMDSLNYLNNQVYYIKLEDGRELSIDPETGRLRDSSSVVLL